MGVSDGKAIGSEGKLALNLSSMNLILHAVAAAATATRISKRQLRAM